jgi:hypothetical protein
MAFLHVSIVSVKSLKPEEIGGERAVRKNSRKVMEEIIVVGMEKERHPVTRFPGFACSSF